MPAMRSSSAAFSVSLAPRERASELPVVEIDGDDPLGAREIRALDRAEPDGAATDDQRAGPEGDLGDARRRAEPGHDAAADQAGTVEGNLGRHLDGALRRHDAVFGKGGDIHELMERLSVEAKPFLA